MESIKHTLDELTQIFNARMNDFQRELKGSIPAASPTSNINSQFHSFRTFVLTALENLHLQVEFLSKQQDDLEMRTRKKILLLHGVPEEHKEDSAARVAQLLNKHLALTQLTSSDLTLCHRLGNPKTGKSRAILIKFKEFSLRNQVWTSKSNLKGTGVTISEFLTKRRHKIFVAARQRFGVAKCWTRDGVIFVLSADGTRHRLSSMPDLDAVPSSNASTSEASVMSPNEDVSKPSKPTITRTKRTVKK
ncbi:uncharacterized protein LOC125075594 [Vanessa atalanta]|uniref:uncharacterized protein LOC125075594 n=1 Tax=Vanessa atalanta TaxID=42275 RepID=UPI001FCD27E9|nr:uncharacterized protein LOC125075594 [Vanessa atalanta]